MSYYGIHRNKPDDEICHFKYIKRIKTAKGYRYFYDDSEAQKYEKGKTSEMTKSDSNGHTTKRKVTYAESDRIFDSKQEKKSTTTATTVQSDGSKGPRTTTTSYETTYSRGKLSRAAQKGEKWVYDNVLSKVNKAKDKTAVKSEKITNNKTPIKADNKSAKIAVKSEKIANSKAPIKIDDVKYKIRDPEERVKKKMYDASGGKEKAAYEQAEKKAREANEKYYEAEDNLASKAFSGEAEYKKAAAERDKAKAESDRLYNEYEAAKNAYEDTRLYRMEQSKKKRRS